MADAEPRYLETPDGAKLAYHLVEGRDPTVVFLSGFASHMGGTKAQYLEQWCRDRGQAYLRLDYQGHGKSSGAFEDGTIGVWARDALAVIEAATDGPLDGRVAGLLGVASAPDFTEELIHAHLDSRQKARLNKEGRLERASQYEQGPNVVTLRMIEDGREHLQLGELIPLECPVRLLHGLVDADVPWEISLRLCDRLESENVRVTLVKDGGHRLSEPPHLALLAATLDELLATVAADG